LGGEIVSDMQFLDDDDWMKTTIDSIEFTLKATTKSQMSHDEELEEASE
jgi:hypothetical protein